MVVFKVWALVIVLLASHIIRVQEIIFDLPLLFKRPDLSKFGCQSHLLLKLLVHELSLE